MMKSLELATSSNNMRDAPNSNAELNRATSYDVSLKIATSLTHIEEDKPNRKGWHISYTQRKLTLGIAKSSLTLEDARCP